ncbi:hypothetical protein [Streptomyces sp. NPDC059863]|uniref:hypothetical protein n=1 Tax=unclassified Streptomyces TaxID=2593676 RepID=UPI00365E47F1
MRHTRPVRAAAPAATLPPADGAGSVRAVVELVHRTDRDVGNPTVHVESRVTG